MSEVYFGHGYVWKRNGKNRKNIESLGDALSEKANCGPCGCDGALGLWTQINASDGELLGMYITDDGEGGYTLVIEDYDTALANVKALCAAR